MPAERFVEALNEQVANEFAASHQYVAIAAHYESQTLPQLAAVLLRPGGRGARSRDDDDQVPARHGLARAAARGRRAPRRTSPTTSRRSGSRSSRSRR